MVDLFVVKNEDYIDAVAEIIFKLEVIDYFIYDGKLNSCPDWLLDALEEKNAFRNNVTKTIKVFSGDGLAFIEPDALVVRTQGELTYKVQVLYGNVRNPT